VSRGTLFIGVDFETGLMTARSPLHGILGSVEFLHETAVSAYQAGLFSSIETCGKTLLDTIDHVLDYAKINKLRKGNSTRKRGHHSKSGFRRETVGSIVGLTAEFDLAALVEEVVDAVTAGHAFRRTHHGRLHDHQIASGGGGLSIALSTDSSLVEQSTALPEMEPAVILDIKPRHSWFVRTQPGALRRIVMNLLGNALKYTDAGFVGVSLQVESETEGNVRIRLRFVDSGKGMSLEFQRTRLFSPFSQEDPFASGTGLGLSIVRQIVDALDGTISVSSTQNLGTEVDVVLTLPTVEKVPDHEPLDTDFVKGSKMCIVDPCDLATEAGMELRGPDYKGLDYLEDTLQSSAEEWFGMQIERRGDQASGSDGDIPAPCACDYMLFPLPPSSTDMLLKWHSDQAASTGPRNVIVLCSNTAQASDFRATVAGPLLDKGIQAVPVTQPLGPRKFASVMHKFGKDKGQAQDIDFVTAAQKPRIVIGRQDSDPETMRRERDMVREAEKARIAEQQEAETAEKVPPGAPVPTITTPNGAHLSLRPGPGVIVNSEGEADRGNFSSGSPAVAKPNAAEQQNLSLARARAGSVSRSISAPPERTNLPQQQQQQNGTGGRAAGAESTPTATAPSSPPTGPPCARPHVLLVDDNEINLQLLVMFMKKQNFSYATACNGLVALEKYEAACGGVGGIVGGVGVGGGGSMTPAALPSPPLSSCEGGSPAATPAAEQAEASSGGLFPSASAPAPAITTHTHQQKPFTHVLMDLSMPVMDGLTSTRKIRALEAARALQPPATIIALTGLASAEAQDDALVAGINKFLVKPVKFGELKGLLKG
jgi:signal transduction histidine kinase/CheY-like chemotaxis protein